MDEARVVRFIVPEILLHFRRHRFVDHFVDECAWFLRIDCLVAIGVDDFALIVHHVVEIEGPFSDQVIALLDALLRRLDRLIQPTMLELLAFLEPETLHYSRHAIGCAEVAHEVVLEADIKAGTAWVALARATPA